MSSPKDEQHFHHVLGGYKASLVSLVFSSTLRPSCSPYPTSKAVRPEALPLILLLEACSISDTASRVQLHPYRAPRERRLTWLDVPAARVLTSPPISLPGHPEEPQHLSRGQATRGERAEKRSLPFSTCCFSFEVVLIDRHSDGSSSLQPELSMK